MPTKSNTPRFKLGVSLNLQLNWTSYPSLTEGAYSFLHSCGAILAKLVPAHGRGLTSS